MALLHRQVGRASSHPRLDVSLTGTGADIEVFLRNREMLSATESIFRRMRGRAWQNCPRPLLMIYLSSLSISVSPQHCVSLFG